MNHSLIRHIGASLILLALLFLSFWIRIQGVQRIPEGQFTANDAYLYYWNAHRITELGYLPAIDEHRWLPQGRDVSQTLVFYSYILVYVHKIIEPFFYKVSLYDVQLYAPAVCFTLGLGILALFVYHTAGGLFACIVTLLLATLPGCVDRSAAGFSDRDAWCWLLGILAVVSYLWKEQIPFDPTVKGDKEGSPLVKVKRVIEKWRRYIATALCGFIIFLGGLSWEGFGVFLLVILFTELWKFCTTNTEKGLLEYAIWVAMFVPWLYLASPVYQQGQYFAAHLTALVLVPPLVVLGLRGSRYLVLHFFEPIRPHARKLAGLLTLLAIAIGGLYVILQVDTFATTTVPFSESRLMQQTTEVDAPWFQYWVSRYGGVFVIGSIGLICICGYLWKWNGLTLASGLALFASTIFLRGPLSEVIGGKTCDTLFVAALGLAIIGTAFVGTRENTSKNEAVVIATIYWFLLWTGLSKIAIRYDFFIGVPLAIGTAAALTHSHTAAETIEVMGKTLKTKIVTAAAAISIITLILFWTPAGGYANRVIDAASERPPIPGNTTLAQTYDWMKNKLPADTTIMAATWGYGSQLNVLGGVKTIIDQDHFIQHWIHLYNRHVYCAQSEEEALAFLKTHNATHLMITASDITINAGGNSYIGSDADADRHFDMYALDTMPTAPGTQYTLAPKIYKGPVRFMPPTALEAIDIQGTEIDDLSVFARFKTGTTSHMPYVAYVGRQRIIPEEKTQTENGGLLLIFNGEKKLLYSYYIPNIGWNSLAIKLFIRGEHTETFKNVWTATPDGIDMPPEIKIWEIHYPAQTNTNPKYLTTEPPE